jgi:hypothetical protein
MTSHHHANIKGYTAHGQLKPRSLQGPSDIADTLAWLSDFAEGLEMDCEGERLTRSQHRMKKAAHLLRAAMEQLTPLAEEPNP